MKRIVIILASVICISVSANNSMLFHMDYIHNAEITTGTEITVYQIKQVGSQAWSKSAVTAIYNREANTIKVGKFTYSINKNLAYGQSNDARGKFMYVASEYYFNL